MSAIQQLLASYKAAGGDPYFANVSLLLHCDGANGSTTFTDSSAAARTVTPSNCTISTAQSKFGGASARFASGVLPRLSIPTSADFDFGSGDFTLEAWVRPDTSTFTGTLMDRGRYTDFSPWTLILVDGKVRLTCSTGAFTSWDVCNILSTTALAANTWYHVAATRQSTAFKIFINGTEEGSATSSATLGTTTEPVQVGRSNTSANPFLGYMDDIRITKGVARYTSGFSVPTEAFPNS